MWLPTAFAPRSISIPDQVRYDAESGSLLIRRSTLPAGLTYELTSVVPNVDAATVEAIAAGGDLPPVIADHYLDLPSSYPDRFRQLAAQITANATTPYDKALALQNWFRTNFTYDLNVAPGHGETAIDTFLSQRRGYCEQFAGTYAAFARSIGLPSRVAVGLHPGRSRRRRPRTTCAVATRTPGPRSTSSGVGWLAFEPTPGRGEPGAEGYTGVPAAQDGRDPADPGSTVPSTATTVAPGAATGGPRPETGNEQVLAVPNLGGGSSGGGPSRASTVSRIGIGIVVLAIIGLIALAALVALRERQWRRRWRSAPSPADQVLVSWQHTVDGLRRTGLEIAPSETPHEVALARRAAARARRVDRHRRRSSGSWPTRPTAAAYSGHLDGGNPARCEDLRGTLQHRAVARLPITRRLVWRFLPVSLRA